MICASKLVVKGRLLGGLFCSFLLLSSNAPTAKAHILNLSSQIEHWSYQETGHDGTRLNTEKGWLPTLKTTGEFQFHNSFSLHLLYEAQQGSLDYNGQTQSGQPHKTETSTQTQKLRFSLGYQHKQNYLALGWQWNSWDREIEAKQTVLPLYEYYHWQGPVLEAASFFSFKQGSTKLSGLAGWWFNGQVKIDLMSTHYIKPTLTLGQGYEIGLQIEHKFPINKQWHLLLNHQQGWRFFYASKDLFVHSGTRSYAINEPKSRNHFHSYGVGVAYDF